MKQAATISKPIPLDQRLKQASTFAEKGATEAARAIKTESARGKARQEDKTAPEAAKSKSGQVPPDDVRLTANIKRHLHKRLKDAAAQRQYEMGRQFTIGELIEELVEKYV